MNRIRLFTAASFIQLLIAAGHLVGHFTMPRPANGTEEQLLQLMATYHKKIAGGSMTILNAYDGLNIMYATFFLFAGVINLMLRKSTPDIIQKISLANGLAMVIGFAVSVLYFFWIPVLYFAVCFVIFLIVSIRR